MEFENIQNFNPSTCISGKIMRLNRQIANVFRKYLKEYGVTDSQLSLLFMLSKMEGITQKKLSEFAKLEKSSLNRNLQRLFDKKYVSKSDFPRLKLTLEGKQFVNDIIPEWEKAMSEIRELLGEDGESALSLLSQKVSMKK